MRQKEIDMIFAQYVEIRKDIQKTKPKLSDKSRKMIEKALDLIGYESLNLIFIYFAEARDDYTRFMRGDNELSKDYVKLDSLLRKTKLNEKLIRAKRWKSRSQKKPKQIEPIVEIVKHKIDDDPDLFLPLQFMRVDQ